MMSRPLKMIVAALVLMTAARAGSQEVQTPVGNVGVETIAKFVYAWSTRDADTLWPGRDQFSTTMVDIRLLGMLTDQISYQMELAATYNSERNIGGMNGVSSQGELIGSRFGVRQASIIFDEMIPWTRIEVGTFIPSISNYMPRSPHNLDFIQYPLINNASGMDLDVFTPSPLYLPTFDNNPVDNRPAARDFGMWQQAGMNVTITTPYMVKVDFGIWNGMMPTRTGNVNPEKGKAQSFKLTFEPDPALSLAAAVWTEEFNPTFQLVNQSGGVNYFWPQTVKRNMTIWTLYGSYLTDTIEITADYSQGNIPDGQIVYRGIVPNLTNEFYELRWEGWQASVGYWFLPQLELLFRIETFDPNAIDSVQVPQSRFDESTWYTIGLNYRLFERTEISLNYVIKREDGRDMYRNEPGRDPRYPAFNPRYGAQENDLLLVQVMVWQ